MIFTSLKASALKTSRSATLLYPRFLCLILEDGLRNEVYNYFPGENTVTQVVSDKRFNKSVDQMTPLTRYIQEFLNIVTQIP